MGGSRRGFEEWGPISLLSPDGGVGIIESALQRMLLKGCYRVRIDSADCPARRIYVGFVPSTYVLRAMGRFWINRLGRTIGCYYRYIWRPKCWARI